ncbi:hypothetical protein FQA39_LY16505 [Lamprigera yunnana]|nr:hypothetical protein FQA39_LY16505 [Lamprigera yunnana]
MARWAWSIFIVVLVITHLFAERKCVKGLKTLGYTDPHGDIVIEYGNSLDITCILYDNINNHTKYSSNDMYFVHDREVIPQEMITVLNESSIHLHIEKPEKSISIYTCKLKNEIDGVCLNNVVVGAKPLPIEDFKCIGYNYEYLTCTWFAPKNYATTTYNLTYYFPGRAGRSLRNSCPEIKESPEFETNRKMVCLWTIQTNPPYRQSQRTFYFELNATNYFGSTQFNYTFSHFRYVLSGPPENLTEVSSTSESVYLQWSVPSSMQAFSPGLQQRVLYQSEYDKQWRLASVFSAVEEEVKHIYFNLTNLKYAHALYNIHVSMRSLAAEADDEFMWSKNATITLLTKSKIPAGPPETNIGSFEEVSTGNTLIQREVFVYWQQIPISMTNGVNFTYIVEVEGRRDIKPVEVTDAYAKFRNLSIDENYIFHIWSQNSVGRSKEKSIVYVPSQYDRLHEPLSFTKIAFGDGKYELLWKAPKQSLFYSSPVKNYTIFWCTHDRDRPYQCTGYLSWIEIPTDKRSFNITVSDDKIHQFAISANTQTSSSGMVWAACTVIHNQAIGKMKNVHITQVLSTVIQVSWKLDCSDRVGSVEGFVIYYCSIVKPSIINCKGPEQNLVIDDTTAEQANITGLKPYETYMLSVSVITNHNSQSQKSDYQYATTLEGAPSPPYGLDIKNVTNSSISITWNKPESTNGNLQCYKIIYNNNTHQVQAYFEEYTIHNLTSYVTYNISVVACTIHCSDPSVSRRVRTLGGYPGKTSKPGVTFQNNSYILIQWNKPEIPRGNNDIFEVSFKEKFQYENKTNPVVNVTGTNYTIEDCGANGRYDTFYVSIRAVNVVSGERYEGPWSDELESFCPATKSFVIWIIIPLSIAFILAMVYLGKKIYINYREMRNVEVKLPPGLVAVGPLDMGLTHWSAPDKIQDEQDRPPSADEELLLVKRCDSENLSGDSSGCSSGHESVTSSIGSGTLSNTSDSGTEHPRSSSAEDLHKNSLRLRNISNRPTNRGYVTMPIESTTCPKSAESYCVLGVDAIPVTNTNSSHVPATMPLTEMQQMPAYVLPDTSHESTPYVMSAEFIKTYNPGYVPFNANEATEAAPPYVVAGSKNIIPDIVMLDAYKPLKDDKKSHVQIGTDPSRKIVPDLNWHPPIDNTSTKTGYVTVSDAQGLRDASKTGYVLHRQFDSKSIKED